VTFLERALELAERGRGTAHPNPVVGAVVVRDGQVVGEGWHARAGGPHAEVEALRQAGDRARGAALYVTLAPCSRHGRTPPCVDAVVRAGIESVVVGADDPTQDGLAQLRERGVEVELVDSFAARQQNEAWLTWARLGRPFVTFKVAVSVDGRVTVPGSRWVSGAESRRLVHELRAGSDAVAVGMGTFRADAPDLTARDVPVLRQPRRLVFGAGPVPDGFELVAGPLDGALRELGAQHVQSLLLEGGPTLATSFLAAGLVDKLLLFVAPVVAGAGPRFLGDLDGPVRLHRLAARRVGDDILLTAYVHEP
jgi:diaminohydroxyphosphoribosylaminopyrimidine deaminase / 5-amino-6-(5-phosphoribosylamino)uracil reductase